MTHPWRPIAYSLMGLRAGSSSGLMKITASSSIWYTMMAALDSRAAVAEAGRVVTVVVVVVIGVSGVGKLYRRRRSHRRPTDIPRTTLLGPDARRAAPRPPNPTPGPRRLSR